MDVAGARRSVSWGAWAGLATGVLVALVDVASALRSELAYGAGELALGVLTFSVLTLTLLGALLGGWLWAVARLVSRPSECAWRKLLVSSLAGLPLLAGVAWVPWSWLDENFGALDERGKQIGVVVYVGMLLAVLVACRLAYWVVAVYRAQPQRLPWLHWPLFGVALLGAAACYTADRRLLVDLYEDFHYGLAGGFVICVACGVLSASVALRRSKLELAGRVTLDSRRAITALLAVLLLCVLVQASKLSGVRAPQALVFSKLTGTVLRHSDVDGDGYPSLLGGLDCAAFDARVGPSQVDLPGNGHDDDCTGSDAAWPKPAPAAQYPIPDANGMNVLLITVDTLRADRMSVFGHQRNTTPNLEKLAREGLAFTRAYAQGSKTFESVPSLLTGSYPSNLPRDYGHRRARGKKHYSYTLTPEAQTLTELLQERKYRTRAVVALDLMRVLGLDRGFEKLEVSSNITGRAKRYLSSARAPFFLWLHYVEPHNPYAKHEKYAFGDTDLDRYDGEVARVDALIGQVLRELEQRKLADSTIVVLTADHGEEFGEHGAQYHGNKLYEELLHVPLIVKVPGFESARVDEPVELTDVVPSLCEALELLPSCSDFDGQSLWATLAGKRDQSPGRRGVYSEALMRSGVLQLRSLRSEGFRLILNLEAQTLELFDLKQDPREQHNVFRREPERVQRMRDEMALRPYRRLAPAFQNVARDSSALVQALPRIRSESLLLQALDLIAQHPSREARSALETLKTRPGLSDGSKARVDELLAQSPNRKP